jgi:hypothetical protein
LLIFGRALSRPACYARIRGRGQRKKICLTPDSPGDSGPSSAWPRCGRAGLWPRAAHPSGRGHVLAHRFSQEPTCARAEPWFFRLRWMIYTRQQHQEHGQRDGTGSGRSLCGSSPVRSAPAHRIRTASPGAVHCALGNRTRAHRRYILRAARIAARNGAGGPAGVSSGTGIAGKKFPSPRHSTSSLGLRNPGRVGPGRLRNRP